MKMKETVVYFVRHAQPDFSNHDDRERPLTEKGLRDSVKVTRYLSEQDINCILSSPFRRAKETLHDFAVTNGLPIVEVEDFRERRVDSIWIEDFTEFSRRQWEDFNYRLKDGESLREVQDRNVAALYQVLKDYQGKHIAVGSHGTALSTLIHYFHPEFGYAEFDRIRMCMPWIVKFRFLGDTFLECTYIEI